MNDRRCRLEFDVAAWWTTIDHEMETLTVRELEREMKVESGYEWLLASTPCCVFLLLP